MMASMQDDTRTILRDYLARVESASDAAAELRSILSAPITEELDEQLREAQHEVSTETLTCAVSILKGIVDYLQLQNIPEDVFYEQLWAQITENAIFASEEMRQSALFYLIYSPCMPYRQINNMISMEEGEFSDRQVKLEDEIMQLYAASNRQFNQRTHEASAILDIIGSQADVRDKVVLLTMLLVFLRQNAEGE